MYNFLKVGVWVQVRIWRCIKYEETTNYILVDIYINTCKPAEKRERKFFLSFKTNKHTAIDSER